MDIVTHCNVPRYLHNDFPLGNPLGPPDDRTTQRNSVEKALEMAITSTKAVIEISDATWPGDPNWRSVYGRVDDSNRDLLRQMGEENRRKRAENKAGGLLR